MEAVMIKHENKGSKHFVTPLTEKAARFLNSFVGRTITMTDKEWQSVRMEMGAHHCWVMGE
jgi:hypothetical protein